MAEASFDWQGKLAGTCAIHAVRHALLCLGVPTTSSEVKGALGANLSVHWNGIDVPPLVRGLKKLGCDATTLDHDSARTYLRRVDAELDLGRSLLVCVNNEKHWVTVTGRWQGRYVWIASRARELFGSWSADELVEQCRYDDDGREKLWALSARTGSQEPLSMVPRIDTAWDLVDEHDELRRSWAGYLTLVRELDARAPRGAEPLARFLDREADRLAEVISEASDVDVSEQLTLISWVAYCHGSRMADPATTAAAVAAFAATS